MRFKLPNYKTNLNDTSDLEKSIENEDIESIEKLALLTVINNPNEPRTSFVALRDKWIKDEELLLESSHRRQAIVIDNCETQIAALSKILDEKKQILANYIETQTQLDKENLEKLEDELKVIAEEIDEIQNSIGELKISKTNDLFTTIHEELQKLMQTLDEISLKRKEIYNQSFESQRKSNESQAAYYDKLRQRYENSLNILNTKMNEILNHGISSEVVFFLISSGISAALVSGWFFSIFSEIQVLDNTDWLGFILKSLFQFGTEVKKEVGLPNWLWIGAFILATIFVLTLIVLVGWLCQRLLKLWTNNRQSPEEININVSDDDKEIYKKSINGNSFLETWLHILPYILIGAVVFVIIQLGTTTKDLNAVTVSMSSQVIGATLSLAIGGIGFIYFVNIILPRFENINQNNQLTSTKKWWIYLGKSFEMVLLVLLFMGTFVVMYFYNIEGSGALIGFVCTSLLTGYLLGVGLRYKGLITTKNRLEYHISLFSYYANKLSGPQNIRLPEFEDLQFSKKFLELESNLMDLLIERTRVNQVSVPKRTIWYGIKDKTLSVFSVKKQPDPLVSQEDLKLFPIEATKLLHLKEKQEALTQERNHIREELKNLAQDNTLFQMDINELNSVIEEEINKCRNEITESIITHTKIIENYNKKVRKITTALENGYDLGIVTLQNFNVNKKDQK